MSRHTGTVISFDPIKGYGFLSYGEDKDLFCHYSAVEVQDGQYKKLLKHETVEFEIVQGPKGLEAANVKRLGRSLGN